MSIDLRLIQHAQALMKHGSFSRAAEALKLSQPTLSRSIKELETQLGLQVFLRHRLGVEPTDFGHVFLQQSGIISAQLEDLEREVFLAKGLQQGELSVAFGPYAAEVLLPPCLQQFTSDFPSVRLRVQVDALEALGRSLHSRAVDLIVGEATVLENDEAVEIIGRLSPIPGYLIARSGHPLCSLDSPSIADALEFPFVQIGRLPPRVLKPILEKRRVTSTGARSNAPFPAIECPTVPLGVSAIVGSDALMVASLGMVRRELAGRQIVPILREPWMQTNWVIMQLRGRACGPVALALARRLHAVHEAAQAAEALLGKRWFDAKGSRRAPTDRRR